MRAPHIKIATDGVLQLSLFDQRTWPRSPPPRSRRAADRVPQSRAGRLAAHKREALLAATEKELSSIGTQVRRRYALAARYQIGLRRRRVIDHYKMAKHFELHHRGNSFTYQRKPASIPREAAGRHLYHPHHGAGECSMEQAVRNTRRSPSRACVSFTEDCRPQGPPHPSLAEDACARISFCACWPITSSGTCGKRWPRCCLTTTSRGREGARIARGRPRGLGRRQAQAREPSQR